MKTLILLFFFAFYSGIAMAAYYAKWINEHKQFKTISYDLILNDDEKILPDARVPKTFPEADVNDKFLADQAALEIETELARQSEYEIQKKYEKAKNEAEEEFRPQIDNRIIEKLNE